MNLDDDRPVCDFCDLMIEEDESLEPIYVGEQPDPEPHRLNSIAAKEKSFHLLGNNVSVYTALYRALCSCDDIDLKLSEAVYEPNPVMISETPSVSDDHSVDFDDDLNKDKVGARVTIHPKDVNTRPDANVCPNCAEMFQSMNE